MSESDKTIDWSKTTFEGSRREQLRRWRSLSLRERLEALDRLSDLARPFEQQKTEQTATTQSPQEGVHAGTVQEPPAGYDKSADHDSELHGCAPEKLTQGSENYWLREALRLSERETPFPWQEELLTRFRNGVIERSLDIPTGLGKTAVMAIWLVARACGACLPRRLVYVVDRRAVVDQATDVAMGLRDFVDSNLDVKKKLGLEENRSLPISTLRGQYVDNKEWLEDPASPAIVVGTVDMIGSRLLFEGYGVSRKMRPYHAGLIGADTLVVLDEAHLVPPFAQLINTVAENTAAFGPSEKELRKIVPSFHLLSLSATGRSGPKRVFSLTDKDLMHPVVKRRLDAPKRLAMLPLTDKTKPNAALEQLFGSEKPKLDEETKLEDALAQLAWKLFNKGSRGPLRCVVYCDQREVAVKAKAALERLARGDKKTGKPAADIDTELFVGGRRVFEREAARERLKKLGFIAGSKVERMRPAFLFATSAGEVGVDLDADHMVCDLVAWERMVQRLGRVNRRGNGKANVIVVVEREPEPTKKEQEALNKKDSGKELDPKEQMLIDGFEAEERKWRSLQAPFDQLRKNGEFADASPDALREIKQRAEADPDLLKIVEAATTPVPLRPALSRALVDAWAMTSLEKHTGRPVIDPWLRGWIEDDKPQTAVIWRTHLPVRKDACATKKEVAAFFEAAPPHTSEVLETETFRVLEWLEARAKTLLARPSAASEKERGAEDLPLRKEEMVAFVLAPDRDLRRILRLHELAALEDKNAEKQRLVALRGALAGGTLIVDARLAGLLKDGLLDKEEDVLPHTVDDGKEWLGEGVVGFRVRRVEAAPEAVRDTNWRERMRFAAKQSDDGEVQSWLIVEKWRHDAANEEDRSAARLQQLDEHESWAEARAREIAKRLALRDDYTEMLAIAARLHDEGKQARRWQRAFNAPDDGKFYAKTKGPINYALLDGYRHEFGSLPYAASNERFLKLSPDLKDLALHLISAHHGFARPVIGTTGCEDAPPSGLEERARRIALRFAELQKRWGPWGLAWWEALLRAADQQASRDNDAIEAMTADRGV